MSISVFTILRQCENCGNMFEAQKRTTRYCTTRCNSQNYKLKKRLEVKKEIETNSNQTLKAKPKVNFVNLELIKEKEFLTVRDVALLFGCSKDTVYRMIKSNEIQARNLNLKLTRIRRKDIEQLFEKPNIEKIEVLEIENCYVMDEIIEKYKISRNTIYNYGKKHNIGKIREKANTYYSKKDVDKLFNI